MTEYRSEYPMTDSGTHYPLHAAARSGDAVRLQALVNEHPELVNLPTFDLVRPLHEAGLHGHVHCARILLEAGADVNVRNIDGGTPLCDACAHGSPAMVALLLKWGATPNPSLLQSSPLHEAVLRNNWECAKLLVAAGAELDATDLHHGTPLHVAAFKNHLASATVLLQAGANVNATKTHTAPLHYAARHMDYNFINLLLHHGAHVNASTNNGLRPRDLILSSQSPAKLLLIQWERNARSLKHYCRLHLRAMLRQHLRPVVESMSLPKKNQRLPHL